MMTKIDFERMVENIQELPSLPTVAMKILEVAEDSRSASEDLADTISKDQALTAKVLKLVNSSFYGFPSKISTVSRAVVILGYNTIKNLALGLSVAGFIKDSNQCSTFNRTEFWEHSLGCAACARFIALRIEYDRPEEPFVAGLLHDIGKIIFDRYFRDDFHRVLELIIDGVPMTEAEDSVFGVTHPIMGEWLAKAWKLPPILCDSIKYHHAPPLSDDAMDETTIICMRIVHLSNTLCKIGKSKSIGIDAIHAIDAEIWKRINIDESNGEKILAAMEEEIEKTKVFFGIGEETESK